MRPERERVSSTSLCRYASADDEQVSFTVSRVQVRDFRNYSSFILEPSPGLTVIVGPNARGKTNLLEGIQLLTEGVSFRRPSWSQVIRWGQEKAVLSLEADDGERRREVTLEIELPGRRSYTLNGKKKRSPADISREMPCVTFTPDDLSIVKDSAETRREALDAVGVQLSATYARLKKEYERVVRQRNRLLKQESIDEEGLSVWDERLVSLGARLTTHRAGLASMISNHTSEAYAQISRESELLVEYVPSWRRDGLSGEVKDGTVAIERHLELKAHEERTRRVTLVGPHRDDLSFLMDGRAARDFASQGQQRSISLAFKMAEVRVVTEVSGMKPILLLDDVMSELDASRRESLAGMVGASAQTIMTTTNLEYFTPELLESARVVCL